MKNQISIEEKLLSYLLKDDPKIKLSSIKRLAEEFCVDPIIVMRFFLLPVEDRKHLFDNIKEKLVTNQFPDIILSSIEFFMSFVLTEALREQSLQDLITLADILDLEEDELIDYISDKLEQENLAFIQAGYPLDSFVYRRQIYNTRVKKRLDPSLPHKTEAARARERLRNQQLRLERLKGKT